MLVKTVHSFYSLDLFQGKRLLSYFEDSYSYWYNGEEVASKSFDSPDVYWNKRLRKALKKHKGTMSTIVLNYDGDMEQERNFDNLLKQAVTVKHI